MNKPLTAAAKIWQIADPNSEKSRAYVKDCARGRAHCAACAVRGRSDIADGRLAALCHAVAPPRHQAAAAGAEPGMHFAVQGHCVCERVVDALDADRV